MNLIRICKKISNPFTKLNTWTKVALIMGIILVLLMLANMHIKRKEGFIQREKFIIKTGPQIYDSFYCSGLFTFCRRTAAGSPDNVRALCLYSQCGA